MKNPITIWQERRAGANAELTIEEKVDALRDEMDEMRRFVKHLQVEVEELRERRK